MESRVIFEMDSKLLVNQVRPYGKGKFACRSPTLQPLFLTCVDLGRQWMDSGITWEIRHIFSEYNQVADSLARQGAITGDASWQNVAAT